MPPSADNKSPRESPIKKKVKVTLPSPPARLGRRKDTDSTKAYDIEFQKQILLTETIGMGNTMVLFVEQEISKYGGYMGQLVKHSMSGNFSPFTQESYDVSSSTYLFLRESHDNNNKVPIGYRANNGRMYNRTAIFSWPSMKIKTDKASSMLSLNDERKFRDVCYEVLAKSCFKVKADKAYAKWNENHSLTNQHVLKNHALKSLDSVFTDESVAHILRVYYLPGSTEDKDVYEFLVDNDVFNIYTRRQSDRKYSDFAVNTFGFPKGIDIDETEKSYLNKGSKYICSLFVKKEEEANEDEEDFYDSTTNHDFVVVEQDDYEETKNKKPKAAARTTTTRSMVIKEKEQQQGTTSNAIKNRKLGGDILNKFWKNPQQHQLQQTRSADE